MAFAVQAHPAAALDSFLRFELQLRASDASVFRHCRGLSRVAASHVLFGKEFVQTRSVERFGQVSCMVEKQLYKYLCFATLRSGDQRAGSSLVENAKFSTEPFEDKKLKLKVEIDANETQKVYDTVVSNLAKSAPPVPGFRRAKGGIFIGAAHPGKTTLVPKGALVQMLGAARVKKFTIQEIINSMLKDYVEKEKINAKKELKTVQSEEELLSIFKPGEEFKFDVIIELEEPASL